MKREQITAKHTPSLVLISIRGLYKQSFPSKLVKVLLFYHPMCIHVIKEWLFVLGDKIRFAAVIANQVEIGLRKASEAYDEIVGTRI